MAAKNKGDGMQGDISVANFYDFFKVGNTALKKRLLPNSCSQSGQTSGISWPEPDPESLDFDNEGARRISTLALLDLEVSLPTPESVLSMSMIEELSLCLKMPSSLSTLESLT